VISDFSTSTLTPIQVGSLVCCSVGAEQPGVIAGKPGGASPTGLDRHLACSTGLLWEHVGAEATLLAGAED
jgi:hypothetical protein